MTDDGRISIAGLNTNNVKFVAEVVLLSNPNLALTLTLQGHAQGHQVNLTAMTEGDSVCHGSAMDGRDEHG
jgi:hypothetical protein